MSETPADRSDPRTYFTHLADVYDRCRPGYPAAAIEFALAGLPAPVTVADIGAGTGISTRALAAAGAAVIGIEPNEGMRGKAAQACAGLDPVPEFRAGTGEATGLADASVDLVVCAQSFHWLRPDVALPEFHRILNPRGRLVLLWNVRPDEPRGFAAVYEDVVRQAQDDAERRGMVVRRLRAGQSVDFGAWFTDVDAASFDNPQVFTWDEVLARARSASYFPPEGSDEQARLVEVLRVGFVAHVDGGGRVTLDQVTAVTRAARA